MVAYLIRLLGVVVLLAIQSSAYAATGDLDNDGVADTADNCTLVANPDQRDTDCDGYGNLCDGDLDNNGVVSTPDLALFRKVLFTKNSADADFDGDGAVSTPDLARFRQLLFKPLGPSGLTPKLKNHCPVAHAGPDQVLTQLGDVALSGVGSTDADGDPLRYSWTLLDKPAGSGAALAAPTAPRPKLSTDLPGDYTVKLTVSDGTARRDDTVLLSTGNVPPVASAGDDQTVVLDGLVHLDGSSSSDANGDLLVYAWTLAAKPQGSAATLAGANQVNPSFTVDKAGEYRASLVVSDGQKNSAADSVTIRTDNSRPVADPRGPQSAVPGQALSFSGAASRDADNDALSHQWSLLYQPPGSAVQLTGGSTVSAGLVPDVVGDYIAQLIVKDGQSSAPATVVVRAADNTAPQIATQPTVNAFVGQVYAYDVDAVDGDGDVLTYALTAAPNGMAINASSGLISWTPGEAQAADQAVSVKVSDGKGGTAVQSFSVAVSTVSTVSTVPAVVGKSRDQAEAVIIQAKLRLGALSFQHSTTVAEGVVISQTPSASATAELGAAIDLKLSLGPENGLPPKPETVATVIANPEAISTHQATEFLYKGAVPIQTGVAEGTIEPKRAAVIRGRVLNKANGPLAGVVITVKDHPEFGQTKTRADGQFDLAVNGGGYVAVNFNLTGYLPAQRMIDVPWQDFALSEDVVLLPVDSKVTTVSLAANQPMQVAQGNSVSDSDGTRRTTALFPTGTQATVTLQDGSEQPLSGLHVRSTEYTVGSNGPATMPGALPPTSGYTYAMELSVDEAQQVGAKTVDFNQPVPFYVDNFLGFPVGLDVPVGYFDKDKAAWIPSDNGRIVKIVSIQAGKAELDTDGDGNADNNPALGITDAERVKLAGLYPAGKSLWRVQVKHFTPWDCNWPYGPPGDAAPPGDTSGGNGNPGDDGPPPDCSSGSIVECQTQVLGETLPLTGTPYALSYRSSRVPGRTGGKSLVVSVNDKVLPPSLKRIEYQVTVAGRQLTQSVLPTGNKKVKFDWDGLNAYGQELQGSHNAQIRVGYVYDAVYYAAAGGFQQSFGRLSGVPIEGSRARQEVTLWKESETKLNTWDASKQTMGGWTLSVHHSYDPAGKKLYLGDGSIRAEDYKAPVVEIAAGSGAKGYSGDNGVATAATFNFPREVAAGPDGSLYISDSGNNRIRKIGPDGKIATIAGDGVFGFGGDGGQAKNARFRFPRGLTIGTDGSIYIADFLNYRVRKIGPDGVIKTVAGNGVKGYAGDGGPATSASFDGVENLAVAPDGTLYISDTGNHRIRVVGTDGIVTTLAGDGTAGFSGDGAFAGNARVSAPRGIALDEKGVVYFADSGNARIRRIGNDGRISTFAGNGTIGYAGDGGPALGASLGVLRGLTITRGGAVCVSDFSNHRVRCVGSEGRITTAAGNGSSNAAKKGAFATQSPVEYPRSITFAPDGGLYIARENANQILHVTKALPGFDGGDLAIASEDGGLLYRFDQNGRHLSTLNTLTGATLLSFGYDGEGRLTQVSDANGNVTTLERSATGVLQGIVGPYGQRTDVTFDAHGYLASARNPLGETFNMAYTESGLLTEFRNPRGNASTFTYDANGRLLKDQNAAGGYQTLALTEFSGGFDVRRTTALGRSTLYHTETQPNGGQKRMRTYPDGTWEKRDIAADGATTVEQPDGSRVSTVEATDPRFESARYPGSVQLTTGGLTLSSTTQQTATLSDPADPFSLTSLTQTTTLNGRSYSSAYAAATKTLTTTSPVGRQSKTVLDALGRTTQTQVTGILPVANNYDARGRLASVSQGTGTDQRTLGYAYNALGYLESATDPLGRKVSFEYDLSGRVTKQILPDLREIVFSYDQNGNLKSLTPPGRPAHEFRYTAVDLNDEYTPPDVGAGTNHTVYDYNLDQQLTRITRPDGHTLDYGYDGGGRLNRLTIPDGHFDFAYDGATGKLASITAPDAGRLDYAYTGSLLSKTTWSGSVSGSVEYSYDNDLRLASVGLNGGDVINYQYDGDGLLTKAGALSLSRNAQNGLLTGTALGTVTDSFAYNSFGEVTTYDAKYGATGLLKEEYTRDKLGRITQKKETVGLVSHTYGYDYDTAGRLIEVKKDGAVISSYAYDSNGNRLSRTTPTGTESGTYDDQDRLLSYAGATYAYTANGELAAKTVGTAVTKYQYDVLGNLKHVDLPGGAKIDYVTDAQNRRVGKEVNGVSVQGFLWQDSLKPIAELDGSGNVVSRFVYATGVNVPDYIVKGGVAYRVVTDHLGSPRLIVDVATNTVAQELDYDEFGKVILDTNPGFQPFGFAGGIYDRDTGLVRFGARDYDARLGRWIAQDPILFLGNASNLYGYVQNDPINNFDAFGLVDAPGFGESLIPIWGSGKQAIHDFECGNWGWGLVNTAMAVSDVFLVKSLATALGKGIIKTGSHSWSATSKWLTKTGWREFKGQEMHHWLIPQNGWGKNVPNAIKNQPWNLMPMPSREFHEGLHGWGEMNAAERLWNGTPTGAKALAGSTAGRGANAARGGGNCECD
ncbi:PKD domain-containing protein [Methylococcus sp. EFPC2]|uniref:NHL domain-containing protein n=1 Tax=Methylococcus sp. EFPC2 TaxID=2812648 RepID=UPI001967FFF1|nr:PKD domain-containing protein [Methylococcus sp. EFPC2]QSA95834.1 PASTA domain-containing protein [Methylococcus sp. EFPC2]